MDDDDDDDELPPTRCKPSILGDFGGVAAAAARGGRCGRSWWVGPAFVLLQLPPLPLPLLLPPTTAGIWCLLLGILLPLWPFVLGDLDGDTSFSVDAKMWTRVGIVVVANLILVLIVHFHGSGNRHQGHPDQFLAHLGTAKRLRR